MILRANGISLIDLSKDLVFCTSCQVSKSHKWLFFAKHYISTIPFALLYLDLCISPKLSYNNDKYFFLSMVGDDNRYIFFPLITKYHITTTFLYFKSMVEK